MSCESITTQGLLTVDVLSNNLCLNSVNLSHISCIFASFGEYVANQETSDDILDQKNSVFSKEAAIERKIEIEKIEVEESTVVNPLHIQEFINNADTKFYNAIMEHMETEKAKFDIQPVKITTDEEQQKAGAPKEFDLPIVLDAANFFV